MVLSRKYVWLATISTIRWGYRPRRPAAGLARSVVNKLRSIGDGEALEGISEQTVSRHEEWKNPEERRTRGMQGPCSNRWRRRQLSRQYQPGRGLPQGNTRYP